jgi:uncharacterized membrane protein
MNIIAGILEIKCIQKSPSIPYRTACVKWEIPYNSTIMKPADPRKKTRQARWRWLVFLAAGLLFLGWLLNTPAGLFGKLDAIGYAVCHRIEARSFSIGGRQFPLCVRCSGMFLGAIAGLSFQTVLFRRRAGTPPWKILAALGAVAAAFVLDGVNSYLHLFPYAPSLYEPQNNFRLITGTGMGFVIAAALYPAFNQTVWVNWDNRPAIPGWATFFSLLGLGFLLDLLILSENPLILYPLAIISSVGVLILLVIVYTMIWVMVFRVENRFENIWQLTFPLVGGFTLAMLQIVLFNLIRFYLTGTWDGFPIG